MGKIKDKHPTYAETQEFALRVAVAIMTLKSSHAYFIMQKAFGEIGWETVEELCNRVIGECSCKFCKIIKKEVSTRWNQ